MKLVDKLKDMFTYSDDPEGEEEEEVKIEHITKETPKIIKEEKKEVEKDFESQEKEEEKPKEIVEEKKEEKTRVETLSREKTKTPVFFTENDFADLEPERPKRPEPRVETSKPQKKEEKKLYSGSYTSTTILTKEKPTFKPTPIISPIFGILGENYDKDEIVEKNDSNKREVKSESTDGMAHDKFDEVRNKAYGTLENELEETMYDKSKNSNNNDEIDLFDELEEQNNIEDTAELAKTVTEQEKNIRELEEITMDLTKELDNLLLKKESFNSKKEKVSKQMKDESKDVESPLTEDELFNLIDSMYEEGKE